MVTGVVPHVGGPINKGEPTVLIGFMPAARIGDTLVCVGPPDVIVKGSPTVIIGYMPAARMSDSTAHGGVIALGCFTVMIGDAGSGGGGGGGGGGGAGGGGGGAGTPAESTAARSGPQGATGQVSPSSVQAASVATSTGPCTGECSNPECADGFSSAAKDGTPLVEREEAGCASGTSADTREGAHAEEVSSFGTASKNGAPVVIAPSQTRVLLLAP